MPSMNLAMPVNVPDNMPHLSSVKAWCHIVQAVLTLLVICVVAPVIATEIKFYGGSQAAPNWTLFVAIFTCWIPGLLVYFPWAYDRQNKFKRIAKFCMKPRTSLIFTAAGSFLWAAAGIAMTVHANKPEHCTLDSSRARSDDAYASAWPAQCNCAKAAAAFSWFLLLMWLATLACSIILFWNEKQLAHKNLKEFRQNEQQHQQQQEEYDEEQATEPLHSPADKHEIPPPAMSNIPIDSVQQPLYAPSTSPPPPPVAAHGGGYYHHTPEPPMTSFTPEPPFIPPQPTASTTPAFNAMPQPYYHQQPYP
ncbi:hypothetical protein O0I10_002674 [Lichtheimia ornata]|uniref:MARVEL domain-containing protein n=1 Tax=Lichtheimia ornata TaxID=688661 RepID=A0AAD7VA42_9FUNG|nr:uncharacterized protein O0I10_002674 [Lichtheimia ornata]KAJ8661408.1 hypothetical protein O0I10_002674 [Lichtheimia ornata]